MKTKQRRGFTLVEILLSLTLIAILVSVVIVLINPEKRFASARNSQRNIDIHTILNAVHQYRVDNNGSLPSSITTSSTEICATNAPSCAGLTDLSALTNNQAYIISIPQDPNGVCSTNGVCYEIKKSSSERITVSAPDAEDGEIIEISI